MGGNATDTWSGFAVRSAVGSVQSGFVTKHSQEAGRARLTLYRVVGLVAALKFILAGVNYWQGVPLSVLAPSLVSSVVMAAAFLVAGRALS